ncbi:MAG TPA: hypothetical protein VG269_29450 [Tepidisphaeraceae bacterium]|jgi:hypothetical protein|nr:hypothetical protein [Tepidisphaeraceae bacterium]
MSIDKAKRRISIHAGFNSDDSDGGLVAHLRPYIGVGDRDWADLVHSVIVLHPLITGSPIIERELCAALWSICTTCRTLVLRSESSVRRNKLADEKALAKLGLWLEAFEILAVRSLRGLDLGQCLSRVIELIAAREFDDRDSFEVLRPIIGDLIMSGDSDVEEISAKALAALG